MDLQIAIDGGDLRNAVLLRTTSGCRVWIDGLEHRATLDAVGPCFELQLDDRRERVWVAEYHDHVWVHAFGRAFELEVVDPIERSLQGGDAADLATAPMPGTVVSVAVAEGDAVTAGQVVAVIESMKMQSEILASRDGVVERVPVRPGDTFDRGATLVALVSEEAEES